MTNLCKKVFTGDMERVNPDRATFERELSELIHAGAPRIIMPFTGLAQPRSCRRIALFPASFNPPTIAHREMGRRFQADHDLTLFIMDLQNADKRQYEASLWSRFQMLQAMIGGETTFVPAIASHGLIVQHLAAAAALFPDIETFSVLVGSDTMLRILSPLYYENPERTFEELFARARFFVFLRDDAHRDRLTTGLSSASIPEFAVRTVNMVDFSPDLQQISSTSVRHRIASGDPIDRFVCPPVHEYIERWRLYRENPPSENGPDTNMR